MFLVQAMAFLMLSHVSSFVSLTVLAFIILLCYGGGFGAMPAFAADYFGAKDIGSIYGLMLTAWGTAGVVGPTLIAQVRQATGHYQGALRIMAIVTLLSAIVPFLLRQPAQRRKPASSEGTLGSAGRRIAS
jgi:OFA family oxalate/formate antiporter-like MFS transporter